MITYYDILGVDENVNPEELKKAFRQRVFDCHPDINNNNEESKKQFIAVIEAYEILSDREKKRKYDNYLTRYREDLLYKNIMQQYAKRRMQEEKQQKEAEKAKARYGGFMAIAIIGILVITAVIITVISSSNGKPVYKKAAPWPNVKVPDRLDLPTLKSTERMRASLKAEDNAKNITKEGIKATNNIESRNTRSLATGDKPYISTYGGGLYDSDSKSYIDVENGAGSDAIVMFFDVKKNKICRHAYIRKGASYRINNMPQGLFDMRVYHGNGWNPDKYNGENSPAGGFDHDESFQQSDESGYLSIEFTTDMNGYSYPCYEVTLYQVRNGNMPTESISNGEFFGVKR